MGGYQLKERWGYFRRNLRRQWVKFRRAHLIQDEEFDVKVAAQFPQIHAGPWGYSEPSQRLGAVVSPEAHGEVLAFTELSIEDRDPVTIPMAEKVLTARRETTIGTALVSAGVLLGGAGDSLSHDSVPGL